MRMEMIIGKLVDGGGKWMRSDDSSRRRKDYLNQTGLDHTFEVEA